MIIREKLPLLVGIGLPLVIIIFLMVRLSGTGGRVEPKYDFIFTLDDDTQRARAVVVDGQIELLPPFGYTKETESGLQPLFFDPNLYLYKVGSQEAKRINADEARSYYLDESRRSSDGFRVSEQGELTFSFLPIYTWRSRHRGVYLQGPGISQEIYPLNWGECCFKFLGWVMPNEN